MSLSLLQIFIGFRDTIFSTFSFSIFNILYNYFEIALMFAFHLLAAISQLLILLIDSSTVSFPYVLEIFAKILLF